MLERQIDYTWYGIMVLQIGIFKLMILGFLKLFDYSKQEKELNVVSKFLYRFGVAGLTIFFVEQIFSAVLKEILILFNKDLYLDLVPSIILGVIIALMWGFILIFWSKYNYRYGLEYFYTRLMSKYGGSEKANKLKE